MTAEFLLEWTLRSSVVIGAGAALLWMLRIKDPSVQLAAWTAMLGSSLAIPALVLTLPAVRVPSVTFSVPAFLIADSPRAADRRLTAAPTPSSATLDVVEDASIERRHPEPGQTDGSNSDFTDRFLLGAGILYVCGAIALLARIVIGARLSTRLGRGTAGTGIEVDGFEVRESPQVAAPLTLGVVRPVIVLPADWRQWDQATLQAVLAHERSHVTRLDLAVQLLSLVHRAALWHSPLSWLLHRHIVRSAEHASDDAAVAAIGDRAAYAEILMHFMRRDIAGHVNVGISMARHVDPAQRLDRVLDGTYISRGIRRQSVAAIAAVAVPVVCLVATAQIRAKSEPQQRSRAELFADGGRDRATITSSGATDAYATGIFANTPNERRRPTIETDIPHALQTSQIQRSRAVAPSSNPRQAAPAPALALAPSDTRPRFDVTSIKRCEPTPGRGGGPGNFSPSRILINCQVVRGLIREAYLAYADGLTNRSASVIRTPVEGGPSWIGSEAYTIEATASGEPRRTMMMGPMLQTLLEDRFKLKLRRESREVPVYALTVASGGHKLKPFVDGSCVIREIDWNLPSPLAARAGLPPPPPGQRLCVRRGMLKGASRVIEADEITMSDLVNMFVGIVDRPVIDRTSLAGRWAVHLEFALTDADRQIVTDAADATLPSIFTAIQEELGLRLEPARGPQEQLVIESIERPTEN